MDPEGLARLAKGPEGADKEGAMMAAMQEFAEKGNQIFITLVKGREYPPTTVDVRCGYNQTIQELREKLEAASGCPVDKQLLFYKHREVRPEMDSKTLLELNLHTGFALSGYDLREPPVFFPPVARTPDGLVIACPLTFPDGNPPDVIREGYP